MEGYHLHCVLPLRRGVASLMLLVVGSAYHMPTVVCITFLRSNVLHPVVYGCAFPVGLGTVTVASVDLYCPPAM